jgi:hypothetical protein
MWFARRQLKPRHIRLLCSGDRYNYGDLLFHIVTRWGLASSSGMAGRYATEQYGLARSDLSRFGALPTRSIDDLYRDTNPHDVVLLAGGENLAQTWSVMHLSMLGSEAAAERIRFAERVGPAAAEIASRRALRGRHPFPYVLPRRVFPAAVRVMYNSMGGWPLAGYPEKQQRVIVKTLRQAGFLSVRDSQTAAILRGLDPALSFCLAPDCVFLLPDAFPLEQLTALASPEVRQLTGEGKGFLCFQCHCRYGTANRDELRRQLLALAAESGLEIVLVPAARIHSFEDHTFLRSLAPGLGPRIHLLPDSATIWDIALVLASARLFCGTSLHGCITALAYGSPLVPLDTSDPKLGFNLASWGQAGRFPMTATVDLCSQAMRCLALDRGTVQETSGRLRDAARRNMSRLVERILEG